MRYSVTATVGSGFRIAAIGVLIAGLSGVASAQNLVDTRSRPAVRATLMVTHLSNEGNEIDPRARELDARLRRQNIRFPSARVLEVREVRLRLDKTETIDLPGGRFARFQPVHVGERGVLIAVDVEDSVKMDVRVRPGRMVVIDGGRYDGGKLVISIQPDYD